MLQSMSGALKLGMPARETSSCDRFPVVDTGVNKRPQHHFTGDRKEFNPQSVSGSVVSLLYAIHIYTPPPHLSLSSIPKVIDCNCYTRPHCQGSFHSGMPVDPDLQPPTKHAGHASYLLCSWHSALHILISMQVCDGGVNNSMQLLFAKGSSQR